MEILGNPLLLALWCLLSLASFLLTWVGIRMKDLSLALIGVGLGVPTMAMTSPPFWAMGIAFTAGGLWLRRNGW